MNRTRKVFRIIVLVMAAIMVATFLFGALYPLVVSASSPENTSVASVQSFLQTSDNAALQTLALVYMGASPNEETIDALNQSMTNKIDYADTLTLSRMILNAAAAGYDVQTVKDTSLPQQLMDAKAPQQMSTLELIFALLALNCQDFEIDSTAVASYKDTLLSQQNADGSFSIAGQSEDTVYLTSMAICALSHYMEDAVLQSISNAFGYCQSVLTAQGAFSSAETSQSRSISALLLAKKCLNTTVSAAEQIDTSLLRQSLESFQLADGSFCASKGGQGDIESTEYAAMAMFTAYAADSPFNLRGIAPTKTVQLLSNKGSLLYYGALFIGVMVIIYVCLVVVGKIGKSTQKRKEGPQS